MANRKISELQSRTPALSDLMLVGDPSSGYSYKCTITALATIIETDIADGFVTIGTNQTISGAKTFSNNLTLTSVPSSAIDTDKFLVLNSNVVNYRTGAEVLSDIGGQGALTLTTTGTSGAATLVGNTLNIPNYGSALSGYVPYTGATTNVNLGSRYLQANYLIVDGQSNATAINFKQYSSINFLGDGYSAMGPVSVDKMFFNFAQGSNVFKTFYFDVSGITGNATRAYTMPNADGTLALTSDLSSYVPYTGATTNVNLGTRTITANGVYSTEGTYVANTYGLYGRNAANNAYNLLIGITGQDKVYIDGSGSGTIMNGTLTLSVINNATVDTDTFLVSDSGVIKYRTGSQLLSDIGGQTALTNPVTGTGTTNYIPKFTSSSAIGNSILQESGGFLLTAQNTATMFGVATATGSGNGGDLTIKAGGGYGVSNSSGNLYLASGRGGSSANSGFIALGRANSTDIGGLDAEYMRITSSGSVGIGTSSPANLLSLYGTDGNSYLRWTSDIATTGARIGYNGTEFRIDQQQNAEITFRTNSTERLRITSSGLVGIGTSAPAELLELSTATDPKIRFVDVGNLDAKVGIVGSTALGFEVNGSERLRISSTGNVSIGNTNNTYKLDVTGQGIFRLTAAGAGITLENTSTNNIFTTYSNASNNTYIGLVGNNGVVQTNNSFEVYTGASYTKRLTLDASGNLGLGVTPSVWGSGYTAFQTKGTTLGSNSTSGTYYTQNAYYDGTNWVYISTSASNRYQMLNGVHSWHTAASGTAGNAISFTQAMTLDASGRLGIGTTSPQRLLDARGAVNLSTTAPSVSATASSYADIHLRTWSGATSSPARITILDNWMDYVATYTDGHRFRNYSSDGVLRDLLTITGSGNVGIGTTSPTSLLEVYGTGGSNPNAVIKVTGTTNYAFFRTTNSSGDFYIGTDNTTGTGFGQGSYSRLLYSEGAYPMVFSTNSLERMRITSGGNVLVGTTTDAGIKFDVKGDARVQGGGAVNYAVFNLLDNTSGGSNWAILSGFPNLGDFTIRESGVQNSLIIKKTTGNAEFIGSIKTAAPSGGSAKPIKFGEAGVTLGGSNTSGVRVEIDGVVYYLVTGYLP